MKRTATMVLFLGLALAFTPHSSQAAQSGESKTSQSKSDHPSDQDIANAKSQGLVWVNTSSRVYHKAGENYGKTKHGKFMTEEEARQQGFRAAKEPEPVKSPKKKDQSGLDGSANTHSSTPPK
jgi:hypothetical protein